VLEAGALCQTAWGGREKKLAIYERLAERKRLLEKRKKSFFIGIPAKSPIF